MSDLVANPEDRFSRVKAHMLDVFAKENNENISRECPNPSPRGKEMLKLIVKCDH